MTYARIEEELAKLHEAVMDLKADATIKTNHPLRQRLSDAESGLFKARLLVRRAREQKERRH